MSEEQDTGNRLFLKLKGATKYETAENYSILGIVAGVVLFAIGTGLTALSTTGISALLAIFGAFISFAFTVILIFVWLAKEFKS